MGQGYVEYNVQSTSSKWVLTLIKQAGHTTVPQIFSSDGTYIGGCSELKNLLGSAEDKI
jgi:glutaredoxin